MRYLPFIVLAFLYSCNATKTVNKTNQSDQKHYTKIAESRFDNSYTVDFNEDKSYVLCQKKHDDNGINPNESCDFFVMNLKTQEIEYQDKIHSCVISWHKKNMLKLVKHRGISVSPEDSGKTIYIYNLDTKRKKSVDALEYTK